MWFPVYCDMNREWVHLDPYVFGTNGSETIEGPLPELIHVLAKAIGIEIPVILTTEEQISADVYEEQTQLVPGNVSRAVALRKILAQHADQGYSPGPDNMGEVLAEAEEQRKKQRFLRRKIGFAKKTYQETVYHKPQINVIHVLDHPYQSTQSQLNAYMWWVNNFYYYVMARPNNGTQSITYITRDIDSPLGFPKNVRSQGALHINTTGDTNTLLDLAIEHTALLKQGPNSKTHIFYYSTPEQHPRMLEQTLNQVQALDLENDSITLLEGDNVYRQSPLYYHLHSQGGTLQAEKFDPNKIGQTLSLTLRNPFRYA